MKGRFREAIYSIAEDLQSTTVYSYNQSSHLDQKVYLERILFNWKRINLDLTLFFQAIIVITVTIEYQRINHFIWVKRIVSFD